MRRGRAATSRHDIITRTSTRRKRRRYDIIRLGDVIALELVGAGVSVEEDGDEDESNDEKEEKDCKASPREGVPKTTTTSSSKHEQKHERHL